MEDGINVAKLEGVGVGLIPGVGVLSSEKAKPWIGGLRETGRARSTPTSHRESPERRTRPRLITAISILGRGGF
jgi:hypothetical protein